MNEYLYQRIDGKIKKYIVDDTHYIDTETGITTKKNNTLLLGKTSNNIIDLIEVGDYVNGSKVHHIREDVDDYGNDFKEINIENYCMLNYYIREEDIKSIVTKEMMKNVMYEV